MVKTLKDVNLTENEYKTMISKVKVSEEKINEIFQKLYDYVQKAVVKVPLEPSCKIELIHLSHIDEEDKSILNAEVIKIDERDYQIIIYPKLIEELFRHAHFVMSYSKIFTKIPRTHKDIHALTETILLYWLVFIFSHEYCHILWGHLDSDFNENFNFNELHVDTHFTNEEIELMRVLEAEADYNGIRMALGIYNLTKDIVYDFFKVECNEIEKLKDFTLSLNFLFEWFENTSSKNSCRLHPLASERLSVINEAIMSSPDKNLKHLNLLEFQLSTMQASINHKISLNMQLNEILKIVNDGKKFMDYANIIKKEKINPFRKRYTIKKNEGI